MEERKEKYKSSDIKAYGSLAELTKGQGGIYADQAGGGSQIG